LIQDWGEMGGLIKHGFVSPRVLEFEIPAAAWPGVVVVDATGARLWALGEKRRDGRVKGLT
jgi:hypothetical protein